MIQECLKEDKSFGVVLIRQGMEALGPLADPHPIGCTARIVEKEVLDDGRMNITAIGEERFRILDLDHNSIYLSGQVESLPLEQLHLIQIFRARRSLTSSVYQYLKLLRAINAGEFELEGLQLPDDPLLLMYFAASLLQLPSVEKQPLLSSPNAFDLLRLLCRLYKREIALLSHMQASPGLTAERSSWLN